MEGIKEIGLYRGTSDSRRRMVEELPTWTQTAAEKINRNSQEIKELQEKVITLEKINEVDAHEKQELKNEISELKEQIELLKEEIAKLATKQQDGELIAVIEQTPPPKYQN